MKRKIVLGLAILAMVPILANCQRIARMPELIAKRAGFPSSTAPAPRQTTPEATPAMSRGSGELESRSITVAGEQRQYFVYAPPSVSRDAPAPMVMAFHGGGGGALQFADRMKLVNMADRHGMVLVVPQGASRPGGKKGSWNAGSITPQGYAEKAGVDDVGFVRALINTVPNEFAVDRSRVYAMGYSKGGMMAYHAACNLGGSISGIAAVSATLSAASCPNPQGVSVLHIHGTNDQNVPFEGGTGANTGRSGNWPAVSRGLNYFTSANQCSSQAITLTPASDTTCSVNSCGNNEQVQLCLVRNGGHAWPGSEPAGWQVKQNVYVSQNFDATDYIARFLLQQ